MLSHLTVGSGEGAVGIGDGVCEGGIETDGVAVGAGDGSLLGGIEGDSVGIGEGA